MKELKSVKNISQNNVVILRIDADLPINNDEIIDNSRLIKSIPTIKLLLERKNKIIITGHLGRPDGIDKKLSLKPVYLDLIQILEKDCGGDCVRNIFVDDIKDEEKLKKSIENNEIIFLENLRFYKEEERGDTSLFLELKKVASVFVNDAFAVAHRKAASVLLHREMETYYGLNFVEEVEKISQILERKEKPMVLVLGGAKEDKLKYIDKLSKIADYILVGGKLPKLDLRSQISDFSNVIWAELREDGLDLSDKDIKDFKEVIKTAKTIIWSGAMGFYENKNCQKGTEEIAKAIAENKAYTIIAGGDTLASILNLGLKNKIDFICSGGGVMLEILANGDLPAWK